MALEIAWIQAISGFVTGIVTGNRSAASSTAVMGGGVYMILVSSPSQQSGYQVLDPLKFSDTIQQQPNVEYITITQQVTFVTVARLDLSSNGHS